MRVEGKGAKKKIHISAISDGTSIDHIPGGNALRLVRVLGVPKGSVVTMALNVESRKLGKKDLIFIENKELSEEELNKIKIIARNATVNTIRNFNVVKKARLGLPTHVEGIIECINPSCITNVEGNPTRFYIKHGPLRAKCFYCETMMSEEEVMKGIK